MQLCVLARHAESAYNVQGRLNGDPAVEVDLTARGREQAHELGVYLAQAPIDLCLHTRFPRTLETARLALDVRRGPVALECEPGLDDIDVGDLEGCPAADYQAWKASHGRADRLPGGESMRDATLRYAEALRSLAERPEAVLLVVCHELPLRFAVNAAAGRDDVAGPVHEIAHAVPYLFEAAALRLAADRLRAHAEGRWGEARPAGRTA